MWELVGGSRNVAATKESIAALAANLPSGPVTDCIAAKAFAATPGGQRTAEACNIADDPFARFLDLFFGESHHQLLHDPRRFGFREKAMPRWHRRPRATAVDGGHQ